MEQETIIALCTMINQNILMIAFSCIAIAAMYVVFGGGELR